jgi:L-fucono-1,5-lactonase
MSTVDAHHHFWDPSRADYPWMSRELEPIARPFGPHDLAPLAAAAGIDITILVQTRASLDETREFLDIAASSPLVAGVVGWVDLTDPAVADVIAAVLAAPGGRHLVGIRHQVHDEPDPNWLLRPDVHRGLAAVAEAGLAYDLLVRSRELPAALRVAEAFPELRLVIDHLAKPAIRHGAIEPWATLIRPFGTLGNVSCKLSGLVTEADWARWQVRDLGPFVEVVLETFEPARIMFGSDWPVCLLAGSYTQVVETARKLMADLSDDERDLVFGGVATRVYRLDAQR